MFALPKEVFLKLPSNSAPLTTGHTFRMPRITGMYFCFCIICIAISWLSLATVQNVLAQGIADISPDNTATALTDPVPLESSSIALPTPLESSQEKPYVSEEGVPAKCLANGQKGCVQTSASGLRETLRTLAGVSSV